MNVFIKGMIIMLTLYPFDWTENDVNKPFNVLNAGFLDPSSSDQGSLPTALSSAQMSNLIDPDYDDPVRVRDNLAASGINPTVFKNMIDVQYVLDTRYALFSSLIKFDRLVNFDEPEEWHLINAHDVIYKSTKDEDYSTVILNPGYSDLVFAKEDAWSPSPLILSTAENLNIGVQVGQTEIIGGSFRTFNKPVEAIGIVATNLDTLSGWELWGSDNNENWISLTKSSLDVGGWSNGEFFYSNFRGESVQYRIIKLAEQEKYKFFKVTINSTTATSISKVFPLNLTGELGVSVDGSNFEYLKGVPKIEGKPTVIKDPGIGDYVDRVGEYGGIPNNPAIDNYLTTLAGIGIDNENNYLLAVDSVLCAIKQFDIDTGDCVGYFQPSSPNPFAIQFFGVKSLGNYYYTIDEIGGTTTVTKRQKATPSVVDDTILSINVGGNIAMTVDDDYLYAAFYHAGSGLNYLQKIDLSTHVVMNEISKAHLADSPAMPTYQSFEIDNDYLYGFDRRATTLKLVKLNKSDLSTELTSLGWYEGTTYYTFDFLKYPVFAGMDENYVYLTVYVSQASATGVKDVIKLRKDTFAFVDRKQGVSSRPPPVGPIQFEYRIAIADETYLWLGNMITSPPLLIDDTYINKYYKTNTYNKDERYIEFDISKADNFKFFSALRYILNPLSNDQTAYYDVRNIALYNDPLKLTTQKVESEYISTVDYFPDLNAAINPLYGNVEANATGPWESITHGQVWDVNLDPDYVHSGLYSLVNVNPGSEFISQLTLKNTINKEKEINIDFQAFAIDYRGIISIKNSDDGQVLLDDTIIELNDWTNILSTKTLDNECSKIDVTIQPENPNTINDAAPNESCTSVTTFGHTEDVSTFGWDAGVVDNKYFHGGACSLKYVAGWGVNTLSMIVNQGVSVIPSGTAITLNFWIDRPIGANVTLKIETDRGQILFHEAALSSGWNNIVINNAFVTADISEVIFTMISDASNVIMHIDDVSLTHTVLNARSYIIDSFSIAVADTVQVFESLEQKKYTVKNGNLGEISDVDSLFSTIDVSDLNPKNLQLISIRDYYDNTFTGWSDLTGTATSFYLSDSSHAIDETKYILNSSNNALGALGNTSIVVTNGGTVFVHEVEIGSLSMAGDYSVNYKTGQVSMWLPVSSIPANCSIAHSYAKEGTHALEYTVQDPIDWFTFGIPSSMNIGPFLPLDNKYTFSYFVRSNLGLFSDHKTRGGELIVFMTSDSLDSSLPDDLKSFATLNFVRIFNAYDFNYQDHFTFQESVSSFAVDLLPLRSIVDILAADYLGISPPYGRLEADLIGLRGPASNLAADMAPVSQFINQVNADILPIIVQTLRTHTNTLPIISLPSDREVIREYSYDRLAGTRELAVKGRKRG